MKVEIKLIYMSYSPQKGGVMMLIHNDKLPGRNLANNSPESLLKKITGDIIDTSGDYIDFDIVDYLHDKDSNKLTLYFYTFLPWPVPNKKGRWLVAWECFREPENDKVYNIVQKCTTRALRRIQSEQSKI